MKVELKSVFIQNDSLYGSQGWVFENYALLRKVHTRVTTERILSRYVSHNTKYSTYEVYKQIDGNFPENCYLDIYLGHTPIKYSRKPGTHSPNPDLRTNIVKLAEFKERKAALKFMHYIKERQGILKTEPSPEEAKIYIDKVTALRNKARILQSELQELGKHEFDIWGENTNRELSQIEGIVRGMGFHMENDITCLDKRIGEYIHEQNKKKTTGSEVPGCPI